MVAVSPETPVPSNDDVLRAIACESHAHVSRRRHHLLGVLALVAIVAAVLATSAWFARRAAQIDPMREVPLAP